MKYAFIEKNIVKDMCQIEPSKVFYPGYAAQFVEVPDDTEVNFILNPDGSFTDPTDNLEYKTNEKLQELKNSFNQKSLRPRVDTGLGFFIDGARTDKDNFKELYESMADGDTTIIRDADGVTQTNVSKTDVQNFYKLIVQQAQDLYAWKWAKEDEINACTTIQELEAVDI